MMTRVINLVEILGMLEMLEAPPPAQGRPMMCAIKVARNLTSVPDAIALHALMMLLLSKL